MFAWKEWERKRKEHRLHVCWLTDWHQSMAQCVITLIDMLRLWSDWTCCLVMSCYCFFVCVCFFLILFPFVPSCLAVCLCSHVITSAPVLHLLSGSLALACVCPLVLQFYVRFVRRESLTGINSWRKLKMARGRVTWLMMDTSVETNITLAKLSGTTALQFRIHVLRWSIIDCT